MAGGLRYFRFNPLRGPEIALPGDFGPWGFAKQNPISPPSAESNRTSAILGAPFGLARAETFFRYGGGKQTIFCAFALTT
jgi:hypothetical protein